MNKKLLGLSCTFLMLLFFVSSCKKNDEIIKVDSSSISQISTTTLSVTEAGISSDSTSKTVFLYDQTNNSNYATHSYQGCPSIGFSGDTYFAAWQSGGKGEQPGNYITVAVSTDAGKNWLQHKLIISSNNPDVRHFDPMFWHDKAGNLNLTWASSVGMWDGGALGAWYVTIKYVNNKIAVTKPKFMFHGVMSTKPTPMGKDSSKLMFPVSGFIVSSVWNSFPTTPTPGNIQGASVFESDYVGPMLQTPHRIAKLNTTGLAIDFAEPMIVSLGNNNYQAIIRTKTGTYTSKSADDGITWIPPAKFTSLGATTAAKSYFGRLKSGSLLFILNNSTTRTMLTAYLSKNNGKTWPYKVVLDSREAVSYPDVIQNNAGEIYMVYDHDRTNEQEIDLIKLSENDIVKGSLSNKLIPISHK